MTELADELAALDARALKRRLRVVEQAEGVRLSIEGRSVINFASNNYLGLSRHPAVVAAAQQATRDWGVGATASRLLSGSSVLHQALEGALAQLLRSEAALVFPSGFMANLGAVTALVGPGDAVVLDRLSHASLVDAARLSGARVLVYAHADPASAEKALKRAQRFRRRLFITESIYSMDGDIAPLIALAALARRYGALTFLDEAHAIGVWGYHGRGILGMEGMDDKWDIVVGTLSKALGSQGGVVAADDVIIETIVNKARPFLFTTGLSPVCVAAAAAALRLIQEDPSGRIRVQRVAARLRDGLRLQQWDILESTTQIVPIVLGGASAALACAEQLWEGGFFAPAIRPPTVSSDSCRLRFSVTAEHTDSDIDQLLEALSRVAHAPRLPPNAATTIE